MYSFLSRDLPSQRRLLERVASLCRDLLSVVEVLEPGLSLNRGRLLRQMHLPRLRLAKERLRAREVDKAEFLEETRLAVEDMKLAVRCLEDFGGREKKKGEEGEEAPHERMF